MALDAVSDTAMDAATYERVAAAVAGYLAPFVLDHPVATLA